MRSQNKLRQASCVRVKSSSGTSLWFISRVVPCKHDQRMLHTARLRRTSLLSLRAKSQVEKWPELDVSAPSYRWNGQTEENRRSVTTPQSERRRHTTHVQTVVAKLNDDTLGPGV